jgi:hypothetical protein
MAARGITESQVCRLLVRPDHKLPDFKDEGCRYYVGGGILAVVNEQTEEVVTVGIDGASRDDWRDFVPAPVPVDKPAPRRRRTATGRRPKPPPAPVESRNVLDDVHPSIRDGVLKTLRQRGLDFRSVRVLSPTEVEIEAQS